MIDLHQIHYKDVHEVLNKMMSDVLNFEYGSERVHISKDKVQRLITHDFGFGYNFIIYQHSEDMLPGGALHGYQSMYYVLKKRGSKN